jgi:DNA-binding MarR family transcriptional regulator
VAEGTSEEKAKLRVIRDGSLEQSREEAWRALITAHAAAVEGIERRLVEVGLPPLSWYDVLLELSAAPEQRLRMHELASAVVLSRSGLTRLVDRLEKAGLLRREPDPADGRGSFAVLTDVGAGMRERMWPVYARGIAEHFGAHVSDEEAEVLTRALGRVRAAGSS